MMKKGSQKGGAYAKLGTHSIHSRYYCRNHHYHLAPHCQLYYRHLFDHYRHSGDHRLYQDLDAKPEGEAEKVD